MESNQDINPTQVVNWIKLMFPNKYALPLDMDKTGYAVFKNPCNAYNGIGHLYEELGKVYLEIPSRCIGLATNTIILDLKLGFNLGDRYTKLRDYGRDVSYVYTIAFKE